MYSLKIKNAVTDRRLQGISIEQLAKEFHLPRGTIYYWIKNVKITPEIKRKLDENIVMGRKKGWESLLHRREKETGHIKKIAQLVAHETQLTPYLTKILASFLFWAEGAKSTTHVAFINSDPLMIASFLNLFRMSFTVDENKFRARMHLHEYHNEEELLSFWSSITKIPKKNFKKPYLKPHSGINKKANYKGCISIRYYDAKIAKELFWIYTTFAQKLGVSVNW